jgi:excisionase family DNA binding protein
MSVKEAAIYIGVSERKLRSSIANHEVKHVRFGSRVILRKIDLDSFLEGLVA